jgi:hypothetical protein
MDDDDANSKVFLLPVHLVPTFCSRRIKVMYCAAISTRPPFHLVRYLRTWPGTVGTVMPSEQNVDTYRYVPTVPYMGAYQEFRGFTRLVRVQLRSHATPQATVRTVDRRETGTF